MSEPSAYGLSALLEGEFILYRGLGDGLAPILLVAAAGEYASLGSLQRLELQYALRADLDANWAARLADTTNAQTMKTKPSLNDPGGLHDGADDDRHHDAAQLATCVHETPRKPPARAPAPNRAPTRHRGRTRHTIHYERRPCDGRPASRTGVSRSLNSAMARTDLMSGSPSISRTPRQ